MNHHEDKSDDKGRRLRSRTDRIIVLYSWASCLVVFASPSFIGVSWSCIEIVKVLLLQAIWCPEELVVLAFPICTSF